MANSNKVVIYSVLGVAAALAITIYLLTRKSKKIDKIASAEVGGMNGGALGNDVGAGTYVPPYTPPYVAGGGGARLDINAQLGINTRDTSGGNTENSGNEEMGHDDRN